MPETRRLLEAATALSQVLRSAGIAHAFHGSVLVSLLANSGQADEIYCIVQGGNTHPFRRVRQAFENSEDITMTPSPWSNRLHARYHRCIPPVEIEILSAGEDGPRRLDSMNITIMHGVPWLSMSEFVRAKLKAWMIRGSERDAQDIAFVISRYWNTIDINRIPEQDMERFVDAVPIAAPAWVALKRRYRM
ncbi:hypothetical protein K488DRAFT_79723 [Vararia minispora EC-137]|uniref:Uncharacterized protein n=1 Tax=Vararia minispora EC-137 TaxID=1314806 RepID=A0ACB8QEJ4_9AGAM|nr:hypothetical protein K488DRAFT_79723 [Vararia minispora EC-137]